MHRHQRLTLALIAAVLAAPLMAASPAPDMRIPLCTGLTVVTAIAGQNGDYESFKSVAKMDTDQVHLKYAAEVPNLDTLIDGPPLLKVHMDRNVLVKDLASATAFQQVFLEKSATAIPDTTAIGTSAAVLKALKTKGESPFSISSAYADVAVGADRSVAPNYYSYLQSMTLKRVSREDIVVKVIVNDTPLELPAVVAQGEFGGDKSEFTFLDDERNPLALIYRVGIGEIKPLTDEQRATCEKFKDAPKYAEALGGIHCNLPNGGDRDMLRVIKISYRCAQPLSGAGNGTVGQDALEQSLAKTGKADIYSIYFSFNSDLIREESDPTLREIAEILRKHSDWKLRVNGHTDGIGADRANLDLSKRRAAAVKAALVKRYGIAADRLSTDGFGKSQPKDTNDTLEGRAHNRRVELLRD